MAKTIDYSSADVDLIVNQNDNESFDIARQTEGVAQDLTGYTFTLVIYGSNDPAVELVNKAYTITDVAGGLASITLTSTEWSLITANCCRYYVYEEVSGIQKTLFGGRLKVKSRGR